MKKTTISILISIIILFSISLVIVLISKRAETDTKTSPQTEESAELTEYVESGMIENEKDDESIPFEETDKSISTEDEETVEETAEQALREDTDFDESDSDAQDTESVETPEKEQTEPEILIFVDVFGEEYQTQIIAEVEKSPYESGAFLRDGDSLMYEDDVYFSRQGIDVSNHQGHIDWDKVKAAGYDFAFIRLGYRGYGQAGSLNPDKLFDENIQNAQKAGLDVGVYFFAQAVDEDEAREEAEFVLEHLEGYNLELPVVYDPENILDHEARTDDVTGEQFTKNTLLFCNMIADAGYEPMVYSNMLWEAFQFDMTRISDYPIWYADYEPLPQTPYAFSFWQYSNTGHVDGVSGEVDLNIEFLKK